MPNALFFLSVLYRSDRFNEIFLSSLAQEILEGPIARFTPAGETMHAYYQKEMGLPLKRIFILSLHQNAPENLKKFKEWAMRKEKEYSVEGKRTVNFDPGRIMLENLTLISTKPYSHRTYLADHLYSELAYQWISDQYVALPWCYPDYASKEAIAFFSWARSMLKGQKF